MAPRHNARQTALFHRLLHWPLYRPLAIHGRRPGVAMPSLAVVSSAHRPLLERVGIVAAFARTPECSLVGIILLVAAIAVCWRCNLGDIGFPVAGMALHGLMRARQRVAGLFVMIEAPARPAIGAVTGGTIGAETANVMAVSVAACACLRRILERLGAVAFLAGDHCMQSDQRKSRQVMIKSHLLPPARLVVASLTGAAQLTVMRVILAMAGDAGRRELVAIEVTRVAAFAGDLRMTAAKRKLGCLVVIEGDRRPLVGGVAGLAIGAISAGVLVVEAMAGDARPGKIFVSLPRMACRTSDRAVRADEGELRFTVVERFNPAPGLLAMATVALFSQPTLVGIIGLVTIKAAPGGFAVFHARDMATLAACSLVRPL